MTTPKISVVMPVYNVEAYIAEAIGSVLAQTFSDFELLVVDDGGTDQSVDIARSFSDSRIRIISQSNRGLAGARNTGIAHARAAIIALLDSDDRWHKDKLMLHYLHLEASPDVGVSYAGSRMIDAQGEIMRVAMRPKLSDVSAGDILCRNPVGNGSAPVLRRSALDLAAFAHPEDRMRMCWFDESFRQSEDIELWVRMASRYGVKFEGLDGLLTDYRIIGGALSANVVKQYLNWSRMMEIVQMHTPELVEAHGARARAYQLRYLARRSVQLGNAALARDFFARAWRAKPLILIEEPVKTATTFGALVLAQLVGPRAFTRITRPFLKGAVG